MKKKKIKELDVATVVHISPDSQTMDLEFVDEDGYTYAMATAHVYDPPPGNTQDGWEKQYDLNWQDFTDTEWFYEIKEFISQTISHVQRTERERIAEGMEPAFQDFNSAAQTMIKDGRFTKTGTEIIENIGYMKSLLRTELRKKV